MLYIEVDTNTKDFEPPKPPSQELANQNPEYKRSTCFWFITNKLLFFRFEQTSCTCTSYKCYQLFVYLGIHFNFLINVKRYTLLLK